MPSSPNQQFRAGRYVVDWPDGWTDRSTYLLSGPTVDDLAHTVSIVVETDPDADSLDAYAQTRTEAAVESLDGGAVLLERTLDLADDLRDDTAARRAIVRWDAGGRQLYQDQAYVYTGTCGYVLGAAFTSASRRDVGPDVLALMRGFRPNPSPGTVTQSGEWFRATPFTLAIPEGWADASTYLMGGPTIDGLPLSVRVLPEADVEADTVRAYAAAGAAAAVDALDGGELVSLHGVPLADGTAGRRAVIAWDAPGERRLLQAHLYRLDGDRGCIVAASLVPGADDAVFDAVDGLLRSVRPAT